MAPTTRAQNANLLPPPAVPGRRRYQTSLKLDNRKPTTKKTKTTAKKTKAAAEKTKPTTEKKKHTAKKNTKPTPAKRSRKPTTALKRGRPSKKAADKTTTTAPASAPSATQSTTYVPVPPSREPRANRAPVRNARQMIERLRGLEETRIWYIRMQKDNDIALENVETLKLGYEHYGNLVADKVGETQANNDTALSNIEALKKGYQQYREDLAEKIAKIDQQRVEILGVEAESDTARVIFDL